MRLAKALEDRELTRRALAEARVNLEQAQVIVRALDDLPDGLDPELVVKAEAHLIEQAADFDAKALKCLGRHLLEVVDPDHADAHTAKLLDREERAAAAATRLTIWDDGRYDLEKWRDDEIIATLEGRPGGPLGRVRLALIRTQGEGEKSSWLLHRMKTDADGRPQPDGSVVEPTPQADESRGSGKSGGRSAGGGTSRKGRVSSGSHADLGDDATGNHAEARVNRKFNGVSGGPSPPAAARSAAHNGTGWRRPARPWRPPSPCRFPRDRPPASPPISYPADRRQ